MFHRKLFTGNHHFFHGKNHQVSGSDFPLQKSLQVTTGGWDGGGVPWPSWETSEGWINVWEVDDESKKRISTGLID